MKIRLKLAIITALAGILIMLSASILVNSILISGFEKIEYSNTIKDVGRVNDAILEKTHTISIVANDYAMWDATYSAMMGNNPTYTTIDMPAGSLERLSLDFEILLRNDGKVIYIRDDFSGAEEEYNITSGYISATIVYLEKNYVSLICRNESDTLDGIIQLPVGAAVFSSRPVRMSDGSGVIQGTLIFGKLIDEPFVEKMSSQTHLSLSFKSYDSISYDDRLRLDMLFGNDNTIENSNNANSNTKTNLVSGNSVKDISITFNDMNTSGGIIQVLPIDETTISGNALLYDIFGKPALLLTVNKQRSIYLEGKNALKYTFEAILIAVLLFIVMQYLLFNNLIISRLISMESQLKEIRSKNKSSSRIIIESNDELSSLGESINTALDILENAVEEKKAIFDADPDSYFYVDSSWKIIDYKITDALDGIFSEKQLNELTTASKTLFLSSIFNSSVINTFSKARLDSINRGKPVILEFSISAKDSLRMFEARVVVTNNNKMSLILLRDITDKKKFEKQLVEKNKDLEKFNKFAIDRELRMGDLKKEIRDLKDKRTTKNDDVKTE
jgi:sensor domain CHASE-containing protein